MLSGTCVSGAVYYEEKENHQRRLQALDKKVKAMSSNSLATRIARQSKSGLYIYRLVCRVPDVLLKKTRYLFTRTRLESIREIGGDFLLK